MKRNTRSMVVGWVLGAVVAVAFSAAHASPGPEAGALREEFHQVYPLSPTGTLELHNINGHVQIAAWDRNEVKVDAVKWAWTKERLDEARIIVEPSSDRIFIKTQYPERDLTWTSDSHDNPASVDYTITMPRNGRIDEVKLVNGNLTIEAISGEVRASCVNGRLRVSGLGSASRLSDVNGSLEASFAQLPSGTVELRDVNGRMSLTIPSDAQATIKASTVNGLISNNFDLPIQRGRHVGSKLEGQLGSGGTEISLRNVNGRIEILHADDGKPLSRATNLLPDTSEEAKF